MLMKMKDNVKEDTGGERKMCAVKIPSLHANWVSVGNLF